MFIQQKSQKSSGDATMRTSTVIQRNTFPFDVYNHLLERKKMLGLKDPESYYCIQSRVGQVIVVSATKYADLAHSFLTAEDRVR